MPSSPMLITPPRSATSSPSAANSSGTAIVTVDCNTLVSRAADIGAQATALGTAVAREALQVPLLCAITWRGGQGALHRKSVCWETDPMQACHTRESGYPGGVV